MRAFLAALAMGLVIGGAVAAQVNTLTVRGEGQVTATPDIADVRVGVTSDAGTAAEALAANNRAMDAVMERLAAEGVEERDVQTSSLDLGPRYAQQADGRSQVEGYTARNILTVRVRDLDRLGAILDAVAADGANTFEGLTFGMAESQPLDDEALRLAVVDARRKAELLAAEAGLALSGVQSIDATGGGEPPRPMQEFASARMAADSVPVARGELQIGASVTVVYGIDE